MVGCLLGYSQGQLSAESFSVVVGLQILAMAYLGGITSFGGALVAGMIARWGWCTRPCTSGSTWATTTR